MTLVMLIIQILLTIPLTILLNYFNNKENRSINHLLIPSLYIIIISALIPSIKTNIFLIVVFELFIRNFYITNIISTDNRIDNKTFIIEGIISVGISLFVYNYFISKVDTVIPNPEEIKPFLWFLMIIYSIYLLKLSTKNKVKIKEQELKELKKEQIIMQYAKYKNNYYNIVNSKKEIINDLAYCIMIFNNSKKPLVYRKINEYIGLVTKREIPYGIMQISSREYLDDLKSIQLFINNKEELLKENKVKPKEELDLLISNYSNEDQIIIKNIYKEIIEFKKK